MLSTLGTDPAALALMDWYLQPSGADTVDPADRDEVRLHDVDDPITTDTQTVILPRVEACIRHWIVR